MVMEPLTARDLLAVWERGRERNRVDRALLLLARALPGHTAGELAALTVGQRDALLLLLRERTVGPEMPCTVACPECAVRLEFTARTADLRVMRDPLAPLPREHEARGGGVRMRFRLLDSVDLAAAAPWAEDPASARLLLLERALLHAEREDDGAEVAAAELPPEAGEALGQALAAADPQAELEFDLRCAACGHRWLSALDVAAFLWLEVAVHAHRLVRDVDALARAYAWREADILAMSAARRTLYLDRLA
jgi:hypothetical protein